MALTFGSRYRVGHRWAQEPLLWVPSLPAAEGRVRAAVALTAVAVYMVHWWLLLWTDAVSWFLTQT
jgi:hypothetical protein